MGLPLESVSLPSYPIICGIAAKDAVEATTNMMKNTAKYFLSIELLNLIGINGGIIQYFEH